MNMKVVLGIIGVIIVAGLVMYLTGFFGSPSGAIVASTEPNSLAGSSANSEARIINLEASRFEYAPNVVRIKKGEKVKLVIDNTDTSHGIVIRDLNVSGMDSVEFTADRAGTFQFRCPTMCGSGHRNMTGTLIVE